jgi:hypothetical protein
MPSQTQYLVVRTITEEYEYTPSRLRTELAHEFRAFSEETAKRRASHHHAPLEPSEMWDEFVLDLFEKHDGSMYGDDLFGQVDTDCGISLATRGRFE